MAKLRGGHGLRGTDLGQLIEAASATTSPSRLIELAYSDDTSIQYELTDNPRTPLEALLVMTRSSRSAHVIMEAVRHPAFTEDNIAAAFERMYDLYPTLALGNGLCPPAVFDRALARGDEGQLLVAAGNSMCPAHVLEELAHHPSTRMRVAVAVNPHARHLESTLARDPRAYVRARVAARRGVHPDVAASLVSDRSLTVLRALAANPTVPMAVRRQAKAKDYGMKSYRDRMRGPEVDRRVAALVKAGVDREYLADLRDSKVASVRVTAKLLAYDSDAITLAECLDELTRETQNGFVRKFLKHIDPVKAMHIVAARGIKEPLNGLLRPDWIRSAEVARLAVRHGVYEQILQVTQWCPLEVDVLDSLSRLPAKGCHVHFIDTVKYEAALHRVKGLEYAYFRPAAVAALHPHTSEATLVRLRASRDELVRAAMLWRCDEAGLEREARGPRVVRIAVAGFPGTPARVLSLLARDADRDVRAAVASNPSTNPADRALITLIGDR